MPIPAPIGVWLFILNAINDIPPIVSKPQTIIDDSKFKLLNHFCISKSTHHPINKKPHERGALEMVQFFCLMCNS